MNQNWKLTTVYINVWLYKYLKSTQGFTAQNELHIKGTILIPSMTERHSERIHNYFYDKKNQKQELRILSRQQRLDRLYGLMRHFTQSFYRDMIQYAVARHNIIPHQTALREFLRKMEIYESEYSTEAAYKKWQRSEEYQELKGTSIYSGDQSIKTWNKIKSLIEYGQYQQQLHG